MTTQTTSPVYYLPQPEEEANRYSRQSILRSESMYGEGFQSPGGLNVVEAFCQKLHMWKGMHILDIGSGLGGASFYFARHYGAIVTGLDCSREMVDISTERMNHHKLANISFREGDSTWSLTSEQELHQALDRIRTMNQDGSIKDYFDPCEQRRKRAGQTTFIFARKY